MGGKSYIRRVAAGEYKPSRYSSPRRTRSPNAQRHSPSPPRRELTENEKQNMEMARVRAKWNAAIADENRRLAVEKVRLETVAKRIANAIKQNNRLANAAAVNVKNAANLNKVFKNNKTIRARFRRLAGRLRK